MNGSHLIFRVKPADHPSSRPGGTTCEGRPFTFWPRQREDLFSFLLAYLGFLSDDLDWLQSSQVGRGQQGKDGLIQAGTLSQAVLLGDSVEGSEVEPICVRLHVCLC